MKKTFKTVLTMLLVLTMLFGVAAPAVAATTEGLSSQSSAAGGSSSTIGGQSSSNDAVLGEEDIGEWLHIEYTANGIIVEFDPVVKSILSTTKEDIARVISLVVEAAKSLIIDDMKEGIFGDASVDFTNLKKEEIVTFVLDGYLTKEYPDITDEGERYITFFEDVIKDDQNAEIKEFVTYACDIIKAAVGAGVITLAELPEVSDIETQLTEQFEKILNEQVDKKVDEYVSTYLLWIEGGLVGAPQLPDKVKTFIDNEVEIYVDKILDRYIAAGFNAPADASNVEILVADYINRELVQYVKDAIDAYGRNEATDIDSIIKEQIDEKVNDLLVNYPNNPNANPFFSLVDDKLEEAGAVEEKIREYIDSFLSGTLSDTEIIPLIEAELENFKVQYKNDIASALWNEYWTKKQNDETITGDYATLDSKIADYMFTEYGVDTYQSMTYTEILDALTYNGVSEDDFANACIDKIEDAITSGDVDIPWADIWAEMSEPEKNDVVASVKASEAVSKRINSIINEYWNKKEEGSALTNGEKLINDNKASVISAIKGNSDYDSVVADFVSKAKVEYASKIEEKIDEIIGDESVINLLSDILADFKVNDPDGYDSIITAVKSEVNNKTTGDSFLNAAFEAYFGDGITKDYILDTKLPEFVEIFKVDYEAAKVYISENSGYLALIELINYIDVNNHKIFTNTNGIQFSIDEIKALIAEVIPSFSEMANWKDDEMQRTLDIKVDTSVGSFSFSVTAKLNGGHDRVRQIAKILANNVEFAIEDRAGVPTLVLHVNVPEKFAELLVRACNSDKVPDEVKHAVFKLLDVTADDAYGYVEDNGYTDFDTLLELFNSLPIDELLDEYVDQTFLSKFETLENLTAADIEAKLVQYKQQIQEIINFAVNFYNNNVPSDFKDKTVGSFYFGDGKFAYSKDSYTLNIAKILDKIGDKLNNDKIGALAGLIDKNEITVGVDLSLTFEAVKSVTFMVDDGNGGYKEHSKGFLPAGADLDYFANIFADSKGYPIVSWSTDDAGNNIIANGKMPNEDSVVYANYGEIKVKLAGSESGEGVALKLDKTVASELANKEINYAYAWYRAETENGEGAVIANATTDTYTVIDSEDSGYYYVVVTVTGAVNDVLTSNRVQVDIRKTEISVNEAVEWFIDSTNKYTSALTFIRDESENAAPYAGIEQSVTPAIAAAYANALEIDITTLVGNKQSDAGSYTAKVTVKVIDDAYVLTGGLTEAEAVLNWSIDPIKYYESDIVWDDTVFVYEWISQATRMRLARAAAGSAKVHEIKIEELYGIEATYAGNTASEAGSDYEASVTLTSKDDNKNYVYAGAQDAPELKKTWSVEMREIDIDAFNWSYDAASDYFTYSAEEKAVTLVGLPGDIDVDYEAGINKATNAGSYTAKASIKPNSNYNIIGDNISECDWAIKKAEIKIDDITWNYEQNATVATYGDAFTQITFNNPAYIEVVYGGDGRTQTNAGTYTTTVTVQHEDNTNYECIGGTLSLTWSIAKRDLTADDIELADAVYNEAVQNATLSESWIWYSELSQYIVVTGEGENVNTYTATVSADISAAVVKNFTFGGQDSVTGWEAEWQIVPKEIDLSTLEWNYEAPFTYEPAKVWKVELKNLGKLIVDYAENAKVDAGEYTATATANPAVNSNYTFVGEVPSCRWKINPQTIVLGELTWRYDNDAEKYVYNGTEQGVYLYSKDEGGSWIKVENINYTGNTATNAGEYTATASIGDPLGNYVYEGTFAPEFTWNIAKAKYDVSGLVFNGMTVIYNGQPQSLAIAGALPEGLTVEYINNNQTEVGIYKVTAIFKGDFDNYEEITEVFEAILTIDAVAPALKNVHEIYINGVHVITVTAANGIDAAFSSTAVDVTADYDILKDYGIFGNGKYGKVGVAYDITFTNNGDIQEVTDAFTVEMLVPESLVGKDNLKLLYIAPDGSLEELEMTIEGNKAKFQTTHFSVYAIAEIKTEANYWWLWLIIAILLVIIAVLLVIIIVLLKKRKNNKAKAEDLILPEATEEAAVEELAEEIVEEEVEEEAEEESIEEVEEEAVTEAAEETVEEETEESVEEEAPETVEEETPTEEPAVEETPAEEPAVEEAPAEEPAVEEAPAEEPAVEETPAEEPAPKTEPEIVVAPVVEVNGDGDEAEDVRIINGEEIHVRYRSSFMSRLIQAEAPIQDYYTEVKNALLSYKGVKARTSWNFESFNKGRIQCAKLNIKGKNFMVYLGLEPGEYNANKYHFVDVSDKPKLDKVPMMLKVKSERGLKYALELIEEMMKKFEIEQTEIQTVDYHMPYETTEALVARDLVKVILPAGVTLDENSNIVKADVGAIIDKANEEAEREAAEQTNVAADKEPEIVLVVEEVSESADNAAPEAVEETATEVVAAPEVEEAPEAEETQEAHAEEPMHLDAVHADEIVTDEEATKQIEIVEKSDKEKALGNKLCEINLDTICENFEDGETVTLMILKNKRLVNAKAGRVKVLARGIMTKSLTIYADKFSLQAVKMITLAGGHAEQYK